MPIWKGRPKYLQNENSIWDENLPLLHTEWNRFLIWARFNTAYINETAKDRENKVEQTHAKAPDKISTFPFIKNAGLTYPLMPLGRIAYSKERITCFPILADIPN